MWPIPPNFSPRPSNAERAPKAIQDNANAIPQGADDTFTAAGSSLVSRTEELHLLLPIPQPTPSLAEQRWDAWVNACDISNAEQKQRQALAAELKGSIQFSGERIEIRGDLKCVGLTSLPEDLLVGGDLWISNCPGLKNLPASLKIQGNLWIIDCPGLTSLPEGLKVRSLWIENCPDLISLPADLKVRGSLWIINCQGLTSLPEDLVALGNLEISFCPSLTSLSAHLVVQGNLWIINCQRLTSLPTHLVVAGELKISNCPGLKNLPASLKAGGYLEIRSCPGITSLPFSILHMPPRKDGERHRIYLQNTGIAQETRSHIEAWLADQPNPGVLLHWVETRADNAAVTTASSPS